MLQRLTEHSPVATQTKDCNRLTNDSLYTFIVLETPNHLNASQGASTGKKNKISFSAELLHSNSAKNSQRTSRAILNSLDGREVRSRIARVCIYKLLGGA